MPASHSHSHIWWLQDGTPVHAPPGQLSTDDHGRLACHLCGRFFTHLGSHLRRHGHTAASYREVVGLTLHRPLCAPGVSASIAARQTGRYAKHEAQREAFAPGQDAARRGELGRAARRAVAVRQQNGDVRAQERAVRLQALAAGRATLASRQLSRQRQLLEASGFVTLEDLLRTQYAAGSSLAQLARCTGLGRAKLQTALARAGVAPRPQGSNDPAQLAERAAGIDSRVAAACGVSAGELSTWLAAERAAGTSVADLATRTGRSTAWIRARLAGRTTTAAARSTGVTAAA